MTKCLRLATRASPLAMWQAQHAAGLLRAVAPDLAVELVRIETTGDHRLDKPLSQLGGEGLFTRQIQLAVEENRADVTVHSLKDLPTVAVPTLTLAAVPARGSAADAFVSFKHSSFDAMPPGSVLGTGSVRRRAQLLHRRPDLRFVDIRGNVETRLRKLEGEGLDALVLAEAGLQRLGLADAITEILDGQWLLPAAGQGALGLECRVNDLATMGLLSKLNDPPTAAAVRAERAMLHGLGGGCHVPIGAATRVDGQVLTLRGVVLLPDGSRRIAGQMTSALRDAEALGRRLADELLAEGATDLLNCSPESYS
jgi:hydroxymethylbilane synthase